eukprot:1792663-Rhodomonas_salina.2
MLMLMMNHGHRWHRSAAESESSSTDRVSSRRRSRRCRRSRHPTLTRGQSVAVTVARGSSLRLLR